VHSNFGHPAEAPPLTIRHRLKHWLRAVRPFLFIGTGIILGWLISPFSPFTAGFRAAPFVLATIPIAAAVVLVRMTVLGQRHR
jgi:hypothetical protein